jgi:dTDP-4-dehydrorhamnose 3,5-epimerase
VMVDLRPESPTFKQWIGLELREGARQMLFSPEGFAHGFITLEDDTEMSYYLTKHFNADAGSGVRWNDPAFNIQWPAMPKMISDRDANYPDFRI